MAEKKKAMSLNERHSRLLQDLSAQASKHKPEQQPSAQNHALPSFSTISDFHSPPEEAKDEEKPVKVKLQGRRRLCKLSSNDDDENTKTGDGFYEPKFSEISDFDSPHHCSNAGGNEIRGILNDLSSRLESLSIETKRNPKRADQTRESLNFAAADVAINQEKKLDVPEYASASSSFSVTSDGADSSPDAAWVGHGVDNVVDDHEAGSEVGSVHDVDNFISRAHGNRHNSEAANSRRVNVNSVPMGQSSVCDFEEEEEDGSSDDCVILSGKKVVEAAVSRGSKFKEEYDDSDGVDVLDDCTDGSVLEDESAITLSGPRSTYKLPGKIAKMLYPHQRDGLKWLWSLHCQGKGGILGDDMGLGKTMQICGFLAGLFHSCLIRRAVVVAPKTLLSHWIKELTAVGLSEKTREYYGTCTKTRQYELQYILQDKGVLLTTYDIVRNNSKSLCGDNRFHDKRSEDDFTWDYMILDEGHLIKNPNTQRAKSLMEIPCAHRIVVSGTPIQNNLKELWALFSFCCPELLGDKNWFKVKYESPILRGNDKHASDREKHISSRVAKELRERIQPYFLRRLKNEVFHEDDASETAKLSKKNEIIVWLRLTSCQRQLYEAFLNSEIVLSAFDGSPLAAITILKKICDHPLLLTKRAVEDVLEGMDSMLNQEDLGMASKLAMHLAAVSERDDFLEKNDNISCKMSFILALLDTLIPEGHNVLIFSQTRKMLNLIEELLISNGYKFLRIDGTTKANDRVKIVNDFQDGVGAPIFLLTSQVGGLGLTLTKADRVIVVDPAWNPSTDNQSVDRAYRIGQTKDVIVYRLMTCGTIEEKIYRKQIFKGGLFRTATEHKEQTRYFSQQDLQELFSLPKHGFDVSVTQQQLLEEHDHQHNMASRTGTTFVMNKSAGSSREHDVEWAQYAFKPKQVNLHKTNSSADSAGKLTESEIKGRINRLSQILANKATVSKLPDKGERIQKQIAELNLELDKMRMTKRIEKEVIDLDDVTGKLENVLNL
ncbi:hypothetical protein PVL29_005430 [Vitis rotundifolia]|uniref:Protein CHROMATIN REMODELING 24 n=1 Tax=Vitis rotundifolia TaxID=103349 RepID=A0AA39E1V3_VITRO|nr:hypothetical protein PVL29_005430 [Vitis rotundifolia]